MKIRYKIAACSVFLCVLTCSNASINTNPGTTIANKHPMPKSKQLLQIGEPLHYLKFLIKLGKTEIIPVNQQKNLYKINFYGIKNITISITNSAYFNAISPNKFIQRWGKYTFYGPIMGFSDSRSQQKHSALYYFKMSNPSYNQAKQIFSVHAKFITGLDNEKTILGTQIGHASIVIGHTPELGELTLADWKKMGYPLPCNGKIKEGQWYCNN